MIKPMRKYRVPGHIREIKNDEITQGNIFGRVINNDT